MAGLLAPNMARAKKITLLCEGERALFFARESKIYIRELRTIDTDKKEETFWWYQTWDNERVHANQTRPLLDITPTRYVLSRNPDQGTIYLDRVTGMREYSRCPECKIPCKEVPHPKLKF